MKITVIGTGYVGLVTGTCFAETGNEVICVDVDEKKITALRNGEIPIYEPGLAELIQRNSEAGRLQFTTELPVSVEDSQLIFVAVGTPQNEDGSADLKNLWNVVQSLSECLARGQVVVIKSRINL